MSKNMSKKDMRLAIKRLEEFAERVEEKLFPKIELDYEDPNGEPGNQANQPSYARQSVSWNATPQPPLPANEFEKWNQTYWWHSNDGWIPVEQLHPKHLENVVLMIEETPGKFTARIRQEITQAFTNRHSGDNAFECLADTLLASIDLIWLDHHADQFMENTPLYKALKERYDASTSA